MSEPQHETELNIVDPTTGTLLDYFVDGQLVLSVGRDGAVTYGEDADPAVVNSEVARVFWRTVADFMAAPSP